MKNKKNQISIFIIVSVLVLILFIFLILISNQEKKEKIEENLIQIIPQKNSNLFPLKDNVDYCLEFETKRALIISGFKGGFIYEDNEFYSPGIISTDFYTPNFLGNLRIKQSELNEKVLIYIQTTEDFAPIPIEEKKHYPSGNPLYSHSIKEDLENFILEEFIKCINLENYQKQGYTVKFEPNIANLETHISSNQNYILDKKIGKPEDKITATINNINYSGKIISNQNKKSIINFSTPISYSSSNYQDIQVRNIDSKIDIDLTFNNENIITNLDFPIKILENENSETSYKKASITINVRLKKLLNTAYLFLKAKYENRSLDLTNQSDINRISNSISYLSQTNLDKIKISKTIVNNTISNITTVYSFKDNNSKIFGNPFVLNLGYQNSAPEFKQSLINTHSFIQVDDTVSFYTATGIEYKNNLRKITYDNQETDNFYPNQYYFKKINTTQFKLFENGSFTFLSSYKGIQSYFITITDGETQKTEKITFITGLGENKDNQDAIKCFQIDNELNRNYYPVEIKYNKIFEEINPTTNYHKTFGLKIKEEDIKIKFLDACLFNNNFLAEYEILDENNQVIDGTTYEPSYPYTITDLPTNRLYENLYLDFTPSNGNDNYLIIPKTYNKMFKINLTIYETGTLNKMGESYILEIHSAQCLGPSEQKAFQNTQFSQTCCDLSIIENKLNTPSTLNNNIINSKKTGFLFEEDMYFILDILKINTKDNIIWNLPTLSNKASSLFIGKMKTTCNTKYPQWQKNIDSISSIGTSAFSSTAEFKIEGNTIKTIPISLAVSNYNNKCIFAFLDNELYRITFDLPTTTQPIPLLTGKVSENPSPIITHFPPSSSPPIVKCDNDIFGKSNYEPWQKTPFGKDTKDNTIYTSNGYCITGNSACNQGLESEKLDSKTELNECQDYYFTGNKFIQGGNGNDALCTGSKICNKNPNRNGNIKLLPSKSDYSCIPALPHCTKLPSGEIITCPSPLPTCTNPATLSPCS